MNKITKCRYLQKLAKCCICTGGEILGWYHIWALREPFVLCISYDYYHDLLFYDQFAFFRKHQHSADQLGKSPIGKTQKGRDKQIHILRPKVTACNLCKLWVKSKGRGYWD